MLMHCMAYPTVEFTYLLMNDESRLRGGMQFTTWAGFKGKKVQKFAGLEVR
jgi:hypothetical protein